MKILTDEQIARWKSKTTRQLEQDLKKAMEFVQEYPQFEHSLHNEYIHLLKREIAERIGR
jgi:hypothetical protein